MRSASRFLSSSEMTLSICNMDLPVGVEVSIFSFRETNLTPFSSKVSNKDSKSKVVLPILERLSTTTTSSFLIDESSFSIQSVF